MHETVRIVSLRKFVQIELAGFSFGIGILHTVFNISIEDAPSCRNGANLTWRIGRYFFYGAEAHLKFFARADFLPVTIGLAVNISERSGI